jgi:hypothetical protein
MRLLWFAQGSREPPMPFAADGRPRLEGVMGWSRIRAVAGGAADGPVPRAANAVAADGRSRGGWRDHADSRPPEEPEERSRTRARRDAGSTCGEPPRRALPCLPMRLYEAAIACRAYTAFGGEFDDSTRTFTAATGGMLNLDSEACAMALMKWLNEWGCRQFAREYHSRALEEIRAWARCYLQQLPDQAAKITALSDADCRRAAAAYGPLPELFASRRSTRRGPVSVRIGPTGAAKILYALRPDALPPWDDAIREHFRWDGSANSYAEFLSKARIELEQLVTDASGQGISADNIPAAVGRRASSLAKIVDEYYWVTITKQFAIPAPSGISQWADWAEHRQ